MISTEPTTAGTRGTYHFFSLSAVESSQAPMAVEIERNTMNNSLYIKSEDKNIAASNKPTATDLESDLPCGALTFDNLHTSSSSASLRFSASSMASTCALVIVSSSF